MSNEWIVAAILITAFKAEIMALVYRRKKQVIRYARLARKKLKAEITHRRRQLLDWHQERRK